MEGGMLLDKLEAQMFCPINWATTVIFRMAIRYLEKRQASSVRRYA
jgi:hypothetical protein